MAESKIDEILRLRQAPGVAGCSTGPGSCSNELVFDRPNPLQDGLRTARIMEENGALKDPEMRRTVEYKIASLKAQDGRHEKVDYQKGGHPLEGVD